MANKVTAMQANDISAEDSEVATFQLVHDVQPWDVPLEGYGPPDNPVSYQPLENGGMGFAPTENGHSTVCGPARESHRFIFE